MIDCIGETPSHIMVVFYVHLLFNMLNNKTNAEYLSHSIQELYKVQFRFLKKDLKMLENTVHALVST